MVVGDSNINNIMSGIENTGGVKQHNHKKKLKQRFDIIKKLGQGTFGKVQLGINKETGQEVAIKTIKKSKIESEADLIRIRREIQIMSSVHHPNIIHIYEVFENREKMVLVMEYAAGGELYDYLSERKVLAEEEARRIFRQIATACYYCHKHKICHRDLKLENILLDENNNAKIADFGLSNVFDDQRLLSTFCGSPLYASPEIVKGTPYHGPEVDCWSLGVLLYTLVYGAMPFDGSNFKRLVKQISQGDYFEPAQPSPASPLIRDMLTVNPKYRANIEKICSHWWVNENYDEDCLVISEELANQTPVRLDLLLSLAPPPPQLESDKLLVTDDVAEEVKTEVAPPTRSQSVGSLMELTNPAERRIKELLNDEKISPKRKLETTISTDRANLDKGLKRKDKIIKENTIADITVHGIINENDKQIDDKNINSSSSLPLDKSLTQTISRNDMDIEQHNDEIICDDPSLQGAVCSEILEEANKKIEPKKTKRTLSSKILEGINEIPSQENVPINNNNNDNSIVDKENIVDIAQSDENNVDEQKSGNKLTTKRKPVANKKKVLVDKNDNEKSKLSSTSLEEKKPIKDEIEKNKEPKQSQKEDCKSEESSSPSKQIERRRSRIFEAAEKFQNMISPTETKPVPVEKPKKIIIPGVSVDGFKKEFERKASLTSTSPPKSKGPIAKKTLIDKPQKNEVEKEAQIETTTPLQKPQQNLPQQHEQKVIVETKKDETPKTGMSDEERKERVRNAVSIISSALDKEGARKSKSRPCCVRKPPVPFGASGRSASVNIGLLTSSPLSPPVGPKPFVRPQFDKPSEAKQVEDKAEPLIEENKTSSAEITLKSATLPRRKTTKAEIQLNYPTPKPATMEFKTEMAHPVAAAPSRVQTQRSEVVVPVAGHPVVNFRSSSLEPDKLAKGSPKEHIIPISFEKTETTTGVSRDNVQSPPAKPPMPRPFQQQQQQPPQQQQKTYQSQRSGSISRQSTQESDSETASTTGEPIKKSPREYIIPIAVEGGGYVTPRAGSLEPSESSSTTSTIKRRNNIGRAKRMGSLLSDRDSEDDSQYGSLYRHSSFGKDSDTEDSRKDTFNHMHRLRSTRPKRTLLEHNDSLSSGEEDDDDGFEILTAEHLFSNLLSRVRDLTQKLNVEDGGRPGFPSSRLLSHFDHGTNFWNFHNRLSPLSRHTRLGRSFNRDRDTTDNSVPWRRSVSRDLATDIDSVFNEQKSPTPRGDNKSKKENLNLADLDFKNIKLSDEDALALSYLTPGLSRRIQKQLFSQLPPSELKKLQRTLSASCNNNNQQENDDIRNNPKFMRRSVDRISSLTSPTTTTTTTLPRKYPDTDINSKTSPFKSNLPIKSRDYDTKIDYDLNYQQKPKTSRSLSLRESKIKSPESSLSDSLSRNDDNNSDSYSSISRPYSKYLTKSEIKKPTTTTTTSSSPRRISRFLRPDFFDPSKDDNIVVKEKKERELETQKVLKEIRDKRKSRLRRERSSSREKTEERTVDTDLLLNNISNNIKNLENSVKNVPDYVNITTNQENNNVEKTKIHDYVNVKSPPTTTTTTIPPITAANEGGGVVKKGKISRLVRPKSYPIDNLVEKEKLVKLSPEKELIKETKIGKLRKGFTRQSSKERKDDDNTNNNKTTTTTVTENDKGGGHKNKLLQSIEKKLEKFRSSNKDDELKSKKSAVENTIRKLREQSLPRNLEHCTESGLIKRAVSVEDLPNINANTSTINNNNNNKPLQASRKSVTKILGLFKKYEEQENKKNEKVVKKKKIKESNGNKNEVVEDKKNNNNNNDELKKIERPRSLLLDRMKNATKSDTVVGGGDKETKQKTSKLPINSYRRSLNLDTIINNEPVQKLDRKNLKLDLKKIPTIAIDNNGNNNCLEVTPSTSSGGGNNQLKENRNSSTTDDSMFLSPDENLSCDSWSICSDYHHTNDLLQSPISTTTTTTALSSPQSPIINGYLYSGDENESVIDRIRRKSFYTRFNEKKRIRRPSLTRNYKDLDLYRELSTYKSPDYGSLDRHTYDYRPITRRSSLLSPTTTTTTIEDQQQQQQPQSNRAYTRSSSLMNDYVNLPNRYQTYNSRIGRSIYSDSDDNHLDDLLSTAAKSKKYSSQFQQPSRLCNNRMSLSPTPDNFNNDDNNNNNNNNGNSTIRNNRRASSVLSNSTSPASPAPI